jgi:hypothetical protein
MIDSWGGSWGESWGDSWSDTIPAQGGDPGDYTYHGYRLSPKQLKQRQQNQAKMALLISLLQE